MPTLNWIGKEAVGRLEGTGHDPWRLRGQEIVFYELIIFITHPVPSWD